ncbi:15642_t:CDS:1 [Acaulospora morrowiae]|uniref:ribonuclease III n=1 Tax=Acaulospora morrowiae TaxID=94023 RepID=A0A9N8WPV5_9GLOM|nr:15642_t:CDS:1 [Acaulospora morrowiae]
MDDDLKFLTPTSVKPSNLENLDCNMDSPKKIKLHTFEDKVLITEALTHTSYCYENPMTGHHNERLEFLGDSILSCAVTDYIFERFKNCKEGTLTQLRAQIVCQETLAEFTRKLGLEKKLRLGAGCANMRSNEKVLCDTFEAYVGAVYLDVKKDMSKLVGYIIEPLVKPFVDELESRNAIGIHDGGGIISLEDDDEEVQVVKSIVPTTHVFSDPMGKLQMWAARKLKLVPLYEELGNDNQTNGPFRFEVRIGEKIFGRGEGPNKRTARKQAAENALKKIEGDEGTITPTPDVEGTTTNIPNN